MADKITLDFETNIITFDSDAQQGTEYQENLKDKKKAVLQALGYEEVDITEAINAFNDFANGKISQEELMRKIQD